MRVAPWFGYIDGDTLIDLVLGNYSGGVSIFQGTLISNVEDQQANYSSTLQCFPNPANNELHLSGWGVNAQFPVEVTLFDLAGKALQTAQLENGDQVIDTRSLVVGSYIGTTVDQNGRASTFRFVITK